MNKILVFLLFTIAFTPLLLSNFKKQDNVAFFTEETKSITVTNEYGNSIIDLGQEVFIQETCYKDGKAVSVKTELVKKGNPISTQEETLNLQAIQEYGGISFSGSDQNQNFQGYASIDALETRQR